MEENKFLRITMVLGDQTATTVDKYICKLVEYVLFTSLEEQLTAIQLCEQIKKQFILEFDVLEIQKAVKSKSHGRIQCTGRQYKLSAKVINQFKELKDPFTSLREYVHQFLISTHKPYDEDSLFSNLKDYLYYCFNTSVENILGLLHLKPNICCEGFTASNDIILQINDFIAWDNAEKNKAIYNLVSISYEYCMLTTKKDSLLSRKLFNGKRFLLDTNIIFRMAGVNKDERQFVTNSFVKKCSEIGVELYYSSETLNELYRVIDSQIKHIKYLTQGQPPIDSGTLQKINGLTEINDFYTIYYHWCKEPQNHYDDYLAFQKYLIGLIRNVIGNLKYINIPNALLSKDKARIEEQCKSLDAFKKSKRPQKSNSQESLQADINNIQYVLSLRNSSGNQSLWQTNDYIVSADQLLTSWSRQAFSGVPIVVIPSTWLSIMLRFTGRSEDDYKAYCLFMGLRQHREEAININTVMLLSELSKRTSDVTIKQQIIEEILSDASSYSFNTEEDYRVSVENAFESILKKSTDKIRNEYIEKMKIENQSARDQIANLDEQLKNQSSEEEYCIKIANKKAEDKVNRWRRFEFVQVLLPTITFVVIVIIIVLMKIKIEPFYSFITKILPDVKDNPSISLSCFSAIIAILNFVIIAPIKYLVSDSRKEMLIKKYIKETRELLK